MEAINESPEFNIFRFKVEHVNHFVVRFTYGPEVYSRRYLYQVNKLFIQTINPISKLLYESNEDYFMISKTQSPALTEEKLGSELIVPVFDFEMNVHIPFFRKGHYFQILSTVSKPTLKSKISVELVAGEGAPKLILKDHTLTPGILSVMPITW